MHSSWILSCFIVSLLCSFGITQNCTTGFQKYTDLVQCLQQIPYDEQVKTSTIETLEAIIPSYVFVDSVQNSADPVHIPISVNIQSELDGIAQASYPNDEALQQAFASLFTQLQDAHTRYTKPIQPYCYSSFALPFRFYSRVNDNTQQIFLSIRQDLLDQYNSLYEPISSSVNNSQVLSINGLDTVTVIGNFANVSFNIQTSS